MSGNAVNPQPRPGRKARFGVSWFITTLWVLLFSSPGTCGANNDDLLKRIDTVIASRVDQWCQGKMTYPPDCTVLRVYKMEGICEIWAKDSKMDQLVLVADVPICAVDREPGPKLQQGDGKTPEGFYTGDFGFWSRYWWMWIDVRESQIDEPGNVGQGASFKICLDYPNILDRKRSLTCGIQRPGSEICVHGNCVTAGCVSFKNRDFLPVFAFAMHHDRHHFGRLQVHLFPFRFNQVDDPTRMELAREFSHADRFPKSELLAFWSNLERGWARFNENPSVLMIRSQFKLELGDRGNLVHELKTFLKDRGFSDVTSGDRFDASVREAVKAIQAEAHLACDGIVGRATMRHLQGLGFPSGFGYAYQ